MTEGGAIESVFKGPYAWLAAPLWEGSPTAGKLATAAAGRRALWALCRRLHAEGREPDAFRALFSAFRAVDHLRIRADVDRETLNNMMVFGRFANPPGDTVTVWRGGHGVTAEALAAGWSWSTSYRWAAWFAMARSLEEQPGEPVVIAAEVPAAACWSVPGRMTELAGEVLLGAPPAAVRGVGCPTEWEAEASRAEVARMAARALGDAAEAMGWVVASGSRSSAPTPGGLATHRRASPGFCAPARLTAANLSPRQRLLWLELTRRAVAPEEAARIAPNGEAAPVLELAARWGLDNPTTVDKARRRLLEARNRFSVVRVEKLLPPKRMARYPRAHRGDLGQLRRLMARVPVDHQAELCILVHERIAWHGCWQTAPRALGELLRIAYAAAPVRLAREAGGREALAEVFAFAGLPAPWERCNRQTPAGEDRP